MSDTIPSPQAAINMMVRDNIYKAVISVLTEQGVSAFTMERVAEAAGIAKGSIYNHFKNKDDLLRFVYRQTVDPVKQRTEEAIQQAPSAIEKIRLIIWTWFHGITENRAMFEFLLHDRSVSRMIDTVPDRARDICIGQVSSVLQEGIGNGEFRSDIPVTLLAKIIFGAAFDVITHKMARHEEVDLEELVEIIHRVFLEGIRPN